MTNGWSSCAHALDDGLSHLAPASRLRIAARTGIGGSSARGLGVSTSRSVIGYANKGMGVSVHRNPVLGVSSSEVDTWGKECFIRQPEVEGCSAEPGHEEEVDSIALAIQREQVIASAPPGSPTSPKASESSNPSLGKLRSKAHNQSVASLVQPDRWPRKRRLYHWSQGQCGVQEINFARSEAPEPT